MEMKISPAFKQRVEVMISFVWGFLEATVFFIVPDVWLTWLVLDHPKKAFHNSLWMLAGALLGGSVLFFLGTRFPDHSDWFTRIPAIHAEMIQMVSSDLEAKGGISLLLGPIKGIPYKLFAFQASSEMSFLMFILISFPARLLRFIAVTSAAWLIARTFLQNHSLKTKRMILITCWVCFYCWYFSVMG